jgi:hypothetical protein
MNQRGEKEVRSRRPTQYQLSTTCNTYSWVKLTIQKKLPLQSQDAIKT